MPRYFANITKEELAIKIYNAVVKSGFEEKLTPTSYCDFIEQKNNYKNDWETDIHGFLCELTALPKIAQDLKKIEFDCENIDANDNNIDEVEGVEPIAGFKTLDNGLTYLGIYAGGDWETPIFFIIYWDGQALRAYIPEDGNVFNKTKKSAYGNNDGDGEDLNTDEDLTDFVKRFGKELNLTMESTIDEVRDVLTSYLGDNNKITADIKNRIVKG